MNFTLNQDQCNNRTNLDYMNSDSTFETTLDDQEFFGVKLIDRSTKNSAQSNKSNARKGNISDQRVCMSGCMAKSRQHPHKNDEKNCQNRCINNPALGTEIAQCIRNTYKKTGEKDLVALYSSCSVSANHSTAAEQPKYNKSIKSLKNH